MSESHRLTFVDPFKVTGSAGRPEEFDLVARTCLAQGDSWFSIGSIPPGITSNLLAQMELSRSVAVVNCARPGIQLAHMTDTSSQRMFRRLLAGKLAVKWDAIFFSGGGNDLIDAAMVGPDAPPQLRLLATPAERGTAAAGDDYISGPGWQTFQVHFTAVFDALVRLRDSGINRQVPMVFHTYAHIMPRPAPVGAGHGPWLHPAMLAFQIPEPDWLAVSSALMDRLAGLFEALIAVQRVADPNCALHLVDSRQVPIVVGSSSEAGSSGDFLNEIHPTRVGYTKLAAAWRAPVDAILQ